MKKYEHIFIKFKSLIISKKFLVVSRILEKASSELWTAVTARGKAAKLTI